MDLLEGHRVVTIASGGCNVLAYLTRSPAHIDAVDLNAAHIALNKLKLAAVRHLPSQADLFRFFGEAGNDTNSTAYDRFLAPHLDADTRRYWEKRGWRGRRRIATSTAISTAPACSAFSSLPGQARASTASTRPAS